MTPVRAHATPPVSPDALSVESRVDAKHVGNLQPLDNCRKTASSRLGMNLRPQAHYFHALTTQPAPLYDGVWLGMIVMSCVLKLTN